MTEVRNAPDEKKAILGMQSWWARRRVQPRKKSETRLASVRRPDPVGSRGVEEYMCRRFRKILEGKIVTQKNVNSANAHSANTNPFIKQGLSVFLGRISNLEILDVTKY